MQKPFFRLLGLIQPSITKQEKAVFSFTGFNDMIFNSDCVVDKEHTKYQGLNSIHFSILEIALHQGSRGITTRELSRKLSAFRIMDKENKKNIILFLVKNRFLKTKKFKHFTSYVFVMTNPLMTFFYSSQDGTA